MKITLKKILTLFLFNSSALFSFAQTNTTYTSVTQLKIPNGVSTISIKVSGGTGGYGGQDAAGNTNAAAGNPGYVDATYSVSPGDIIDIYPGGAGANGLNSVTSTGGGLGGYDTYPGQNYNGGTGGITGGSGNSGGGGGGGAATVVTINGSIIIVAGGASGGGGMANLANSGKPGSNSILANGTLNAGGSGEATLAANDGGGAGGGGGGQYGSKGGTIYKTSGSEFAGNGGFRGDNFVTGALIVSTNGFAVSTGGNVVISSPFVLPVKFLSFTGQVTSGKILLQWSTASEQNASHFEIEHSTNGSSWGKIGQVSAAGNSSAVKHYSFIDANPAAAVNYYRLVQNDIDGNNFYSSIVSAEIINPVNKLSIYPNPVENGVLNITVKENTFMELFSNTGKKMMTKNLTTGKHVISVSHLPKGTYFIKTNNQSEGFIIK